MCLTILAGKLPLSGNSPCWIRFHRPPPPPILPCPHTSVQGCMKTGAGMHEKGCREPPSPLHGAQPMPSHCSLDGKRQL